MPVCQFPIDGRVVDVWSVDDVLRGVMILGGTGSGKTTGSGAFIASTLLALGCGGLVVCVKGEERALWERYAEEMGRSEDLIVFGFDRGYGFNFLEYELNRAGPGAGLTENVFAIFSELRDLVRVDRSRVDSDRFWFESAERVFKNAVDVLVFAKNRLDLVGIQRVVDSAPLSVEESREEAWQESSFLAECIAEGHQRLDEEELGDEDVRAYDFKLAARYWLDEFPRMATRTRSSILSTFNNMLSNLTRGAVRPLLCAGTNVTPEDTFDGKIIVLDLPIHECGLAGRMAQVIFKYMWQKAVARRSAGRETLPVFLWADECQEVITPNDRTFLNIERSYRATTVFLTQNLSNIIDEVGEVNANALLGTFQNFVFHANSDHVTNRWAAEKIGQAWQKSASVSTNPGGTGSTVADSYRYLVEPNAFLGLRNGGVANGYLVDAVMVRSSRPWGATGSFFRPVVFQQLFLDG